MDASAKPPQMMLTTSENVRNNGKTPEFNSLTYHGLVRDGEWIAKIFSKERVSDEWLANVLNGQVGWVFRKEVYNILARNKTLFDRFSSVGCISQTYPGHLIPSC